MNRFRKALPLFIIYFLASTLSVAIGMGGLWQRILDRPVVKATVGYPNFVNTASYDSQTGAVAAATAEGEAGNTQNIQAPTISGFSSDLFTGGATISYPLALPPGRGGLTPSLSLNYSSNSVYGQAIGREINGVGNHDLEDIRGGGGGESWYDQLITQSSQIGLGWNLGGLGSVFRDFNNRYTLVLNGQSYRLFKSLEADGEWDEDAGKWHTDPTSFLKIRHSITGKIDGDDPIPGGNYTDPKSFEITDTNGTTYTFEPRGYYWKRCDYRDSGCKINGSLPEEQRKWATSYNKWVLTRVADVHNNEIAINYDLEDQEVNFNPNNVEHSTYPRAIYPREINYSGGGKVVFAFEDRTDWKNLRWGPLDNDSVPGPDPDTNQTFFSTKRLSRIDVKVGETIVRQYELDNDQYFESVRDTSGKAVDQDPNPCDSASSDGFCNLHLKLTGITVKGRGGAGTLPPYTFDYYDISDSDDIDPDGVGSNGRTDSSVDGYSNFRLLASASNGYGGSVRYAYQAYSIDDYLAKTGERVGTVWGAHRVLTKVAEDGRGNSFKTVYDYPSSTVGISDDRQHSGFESVGHTLVGVKTLKKNETVAANETVLTTAVYDFIQGEGAFYAHPERGRVAKAYVFEGNIDFSGNGSSGLDHRDLTPATMARRLSHSETDYLREPDDKKETQRAIWETAHFIATKETRSCVEPNSDYPLGSKATYEYSKDDQGDQQWGNLTQAITYKVSEDVEGGCDSAAPNDPALSTATPYRATHNTYSPNLDRHITNRVTETETIAYPEAKRLTLGWNSYDDKGLLTLSRTFYNFPESMSSDPSDGTYNTVDSTFGYDRFGNLTTTTTYEGYNQSGATRTSTIGYENTYNTFPVSTTNTLGHTAGTRYYNSAGAEVFHPSLAQKIVAVDVNGQEWTTIVDGLGRVTSTLVPGEGDIAQTIVEYNDTDETLVNPFMVRTQTRDDVGTGTPTPTPTYHNSWQFYNGLGQVIESQSEREGDGQKIALTAKSYNALGQVEKELLPYDPGAAGGNYINPDWNRPYNEVFYDALGRATKSVASGNRITQTGYYGRKTAILDPNNHLKVSEVDALGRLVQVQEFEGSRSLGTPGDPYTTTRFTYDHLDRLLTTTDTLGNTTTIAYNQAGQKISSDDPDLGLWGYSYYPTGALKTVTDAKGQVKSFVYDSLDRVTRKYYGDINNAPPLAVVASFDYDDCPNGIGQRCSDVTADLPEEGFVGAATIYIYDVKGRLSSESKRIEGSNYVTYFGYDAAGRRREITYPDGEKVSYAYNEQGLLENVAGAQTYLASAKYNVLGLPENEVLGNQTANVYKYEDNTYRLEKKMVAVGDPTRPIIPDADLLWKQELTYDPVGNITDIIYPLENLTNTYSYDDLNRLTAMTSTDEELFANYDYDVLGRMTLKQEEGGEEPPPPECVPGKENPDLPGDLDCDCRVTVVDIMKVAAIWNTKSGDAKFNPDYDFDNDGRISIADVMHIAARWATECGE